MQGLLRAWCIPVVAIMLLATAKAWSQVESALWQSQEVTFIYRSQQTVYNCAQLAATVRKLLAAVGAHANTHIEPLTCTVARLQDAPVQTARLRIDVIYAMPASPENVAAASQMRAREELARRLGAARVPLEYFPAQRSLVDIGGDRRLALTAADCELLRQMTRQVLKKMSLTVVAQRASCSTTPHRLASATLKVSVLMPTVANDLGAVDRVTATSPGPRPISGRHR